MTSETRELNADMEIAFTGKLYLTNYNFNEIAKNMGTTKEEIINQIKSNEMTLEELLDSQFLIDEVWDIHEAELEEETSKGKYETYDLMDRE